MTGQVDFDSHTSVVLDVALGVVNEVAPGCRRGREYQPPTGKALVDAIARVITAQDPTWSGPPSERAAQTLTAYAVRVHRAIADLDRGDVDAACAEINRVLRESDATPVLIRHDGEPWHLHFHTPEASWEEGWAASLATGLAIVLGDATIDRLGICTAPACDRAYLDVSRNGTRRFCSTACQNRVKTAAFRARKNGPQ